MTMTEYEAALSDYEASCAQLYRSEQALHDAHQTGVDAWIRAAADRLHECLQHELRAAAVLTEMRTAS
jgi:hypothetical protein